MIASEKLSPRVAPHVSCQSYAIALRTNNEKCQRVTARFARRGRAAGTIQPSNIAAPSNMTVKLRFRTAGGDIARFYPNIQLMQASTEIWLPRSILAPEVFFRFHDVLRVEIARLNCDRVPTRDKYARWCMPKGKPMLLRRKLVS